MEWYRIHASHVSDKKLMSKIYKELIHGTSLVVQWLRIHLPMKGIWVPSLARELRPHVPWGN